MGEHLTSSDLGKVWTEIQTVARDYAEKYSATRYPYTYAADFLRAHTHVLPEDVFQAVRPVGSRADASRAREAWAKVLGVKDAELASALADGYLTEHGIPLAVANPQRGQVLIDALNEVQPVRCALAATLEKLAEAVEASAEPSCVLAVLDTYLLRDLADAIRESPCPIRYARAIRLLGQGSRP